jgi:hypothetical protein
VPSYSISKYNGVAGLKVNYVNRGAKIVTVSEAVEACVGLLILMSVMTGFNVPSAVCGAWTIIS